MSGGATTEARAGYLPGLDGLRALAVLAVIAYHANASWLPGGYLGVEIFFVISGFIITRGLLAERQERGRISLLNFWRRRALRLLPAVAVLLVGVLSYALIFEPDLISDLRVDALAAVGYVTNWHLIFSDQSYFEAWQRPSLLRHLWSLAIEEQFYLIWPLFAWLLIGRGLRTGVVAGIVLVLALAAYANMALQYQGLAGGDASRIYYGTDTRIGALLLGAALSFLLPAWSERARQHSGPALAVAGLTAIGLLGFYAFEMDQNDPSLYQGGFLLVSLATSILIVAAISPGCGLARLLGAQPLRWLGQRSYGIYLWHWPILLLTWPDEPSLPWLFAAQVLASIALAALSYSFIEQPVRKGGLGRLRDWLEERQSTIKTRLTWAGLYAGGAALGVFLALIYMAQAPQTPDALARTSIRISSTSVPPPVSANIGPISVSDLEPAGQAQGEDFPPSVEWLPATCEEGAGGAEGYGDGRDWFPRTCPEVPDPVEEEAPPSETPLPTATPVVTAEVTPEPTVEPEPELPPANVQQPAPLDPSVAAGLITAIGDSVMLGAANDMVANIPNIDIDASVGRQVSSAISLLWDRLQAGQLGNTLLLHLGNNGTFTTAQFDQIMEIVGADRKVIFLDVRVPRPWQDSNNAVIRQGVQRYANAMLADWYGVTEGVSGIFIEDGVHLQRQGSWLYTQTVQEALQR